jgi:hypothetical protein
VGTQLGFKRLQESNYSSRCSRKLWFQHYYQSLFLEVTLSHPTTFMGARGAHMELYGCEAWSLTLRQERRLRVFENRVLTRIFGPKRDENGEWRRLQNEEFHSLYRSPNITRMVKSRRLRWTGHVARMEESRSTLKMLAGKRPLGRLRHRREENIRMDL